MKVMHVIRREYVENVRRKSFMISTLLVPLVMAAFFVLPVVFALFVPDRQYRVVVVDQVGGVGAEVAAALVDTLKSGETKYAVQSIEAPGERFDAEREARIAAVQDGEVDIVVAIPEAVLTDGKAEYVTREARNFNIFERFTDVVSDAVIARRLSAEGFDFARVQALTEPVDMEMSRVSATGEVEEKNFLAEYGLVFIFVMILYMATLSWGITISRSIVEEKGSRVIEVLLSSLTPRDLMMGKLVGVGLAGMTQLSIWALVGLAMSGYAATSAVAMLSSLEIPPAVFGYLMLYFLLGFLLYSALFMTVGAACSTEQDAQQFQGLITLPMIVPLMTLMLLIQNPASTFAVVLSMIPLFAPMMMLARIILLEPPMWQIVLSVALLLTAIYLSIVFAARVFRVGILIYGKRPNLRELIHWYKLAK
ncbi:MAG: ABC transporter permease [Candidatus Latescibacteria bacterium]|nr:ABC transporter permease [Candidatus Latescibacterota bacterium]